MQSSPYTHTVPTIRTNTSAQSSVQVQSLVQNIHKLIHLLEKKIDDKAFRNVQREFCKLLNETTRALSTHHMSSLTASNEKNKYASALVTNKMMKMSESKQGSVATKNVSDVSVSSESNVQLIQHGKSEYKSVDVGTLRLHTGNKLYRAHSAASEPAYSYNGLAHSSRDVKSKKQHKEINMSNDHEDTVLHDSLDLTSPIKIPTQEHECEQQLLSKEEYEEYEEKEYKKKNEEQEHPQWEEKGTDKQKIPHRTRATSASTLPRQRVLPIPHTLSPQPLHNTWTAHHVNHSTQGNTHALSNIASQPPPSSLRSPAMATTALFSSIESSELSPSSSSASSLSSSLSSLVWSTNALKTIANHSAVWSIVLSAFFVNSNHRKKKKKIAALAFTCLESLLMLFENSGDEHHELEKQPNCGEKHCAIQKNQRREREQDHYKQHTESKEEFTKKQTVCAGEMQSEVHLADILNKVIPIFVKDDGSICNNNTNSYNNTNNDDNINNSKNNTWIPSVKSSSITPPPHFPAASAQSQHEHHLSPLTRLAKHNAKPCLVLHKCFTAQAIYFALSEYICNTLLSSSSTTLLFDSASTSLLSMLTSMQSSSSSSSIVMNQQDESRLLHILQLMLSQSSISEQLNGACLTHLIEACFLLTTHSTTRKLQTDASQVLEQIVIHTVHRFIIYAEPLFDSNNYQINGDNDYKSATYCNTKKNDDTFHCSTVLSNYLYDVQDNESFTAMNAHNGYKKQVCDEESEDKNHCYGHVNNLKRWGQISEEECHTRETCDKEMKFFFGPHENTNYSTAEDRVSDLAINAVDEKGQLPVPLKDLLKLIRQCCQVGSMTCTGNATDNNTCIKARHVALRLLHVIFHELPVCNCTQEHRCAHWLELVLYTTRYEIIGCILCNLATIAPFTLFDCAIAVLETLLRTCHIYVARELHTVLAVFLFPLIASHFSSFRQKHRVLAMLHTLLGTSHVCVGFYINYDCNPNCDVDGKYGGMLELILNLVTEMMCTDYSVQSNNFTSSSIECHANKELHCGVDDTLTTTIDTTNNNCYNNKVNMNVKSWKGKNNKLHENKEEEEELNGFVLSADQMQLLRGECVVIIHSFVVALHTWVVSDPLEYAESVRHVAHQQHHHHQQQHLHGNVLSFFLDAEEWAEMYLTDNFAPIKSFISNNSIATDSDANVPYHATLATTTKEKQERTSLLASNLLCYHWKHVHYLLHNKRLTQETAQLVNSGKWKDAQILLSSRLTSSLQEEYFSNNEKICKSSEEKEQKQEDQKEEVKTDNIKSFALLAYFIYHYPGVDRSAISGIFDRINKDKDGASVKLLLQQYLRLFDYSALPIDVALRDATCRFLSWDRPMFEAQVWMTIQSMFGEEYARQNAHSITAKDADTMAGVLLFLHSNLHNESARNARMSCESFICDGNACLDIPFTEDEMRSMYVRTLHHKWELNEYGQTPREVSEQRPLVRLSGLMLHKLAVRVQQQKEYERKKQLELMQRALQTSEELQLEQQQQEEEDKQEIANTTKSNSNVLLLHSNLHLAKHTSLDVEKLANEKMEIDATLLSLDLDEDEDDVDVDDEEHRDDEAKCGDNKTKEEHEELDEVDEGSSYSSAKIDSSNSNSSNNTSNKKRRVNNSDDDNVLLESEEENCLEDEHEEQQMKRVLHAKEKLEVFFQTVENNNNNNNIINNINIDGELLRNTNSKDDANKEVAKQTSAEVEHINNDETTLSTQTPHPLQELSTTQANNEHPSEAEIVVKIQNDHGNGTKKKTNAHVNVKNTTSRVTHMYAWEGHLLDPVAPSYTSVNNKLKLKESNQLAYVRVALVHLTRLQTIHTKFYHSQCNYRPQPYIVPYYAEHARPLLHLSYSHIMTCLYVGLRVLENAPLLRQVSSTFNLLHELCDCLDISLSSLHSVMYDTIYQYLHDAQAYKLLPPSRATLMPFLMNTL